MLAQAEVLGGPLIGTTLDRFGRSASVLLLLAIQVWMCCAVTVLCCDCAVL